MKLRAVNGVFGLTLALALLTGKNALATQPLDAFLERAKTQSFDAREASATQRQRSSEADAALGKLTPAFSARGVYTRNQYEAAIQAPGSSMSDGMGGMVTTAPRKVVITPLNQLDAFLQLDVPIIDLASYHRYKAAVATAESAPTKA